MKPVVNYLGRSQFNADPYFSGYLDDVRIYNRALTASDISAIVSQATAIHPLTTAEPADDDAVYTLDGIRHSKQRGLQIRKGSKRISR